MFFDKKGIPNQDLNLKKIRIPGKKTINDHLKCTDYDFVDFIQKCLLWDPAKRMTPEMAKVHKWISKGSEVSIARSSKDKKQMVTVDLSETRDQSCKYEDPKKNISYRNVNTKEPLAKKMTLDMANAKLHESINGARMNLNISSASNENKVLGLPRKPEQAHNTNANNKINILKEKLKNAAECGGIITNALKRDEPKKKISLFLNLMNGCSLSQLTNDSFLTNRSPKATIL